MKANAEAKRIPEPEDITAAIVLRDRLTTFNAGARDRSALADEDFEFIASLAAANEAFRRESTRAAGEASGSIGSVIAEAAGLLTGAVKRYCELTASSSDEEFGGMTIAVPAIESQSRRNAISRFGAETLALIDEHIAFRAKLVAGESDREKHEAEILRALRGCPTTGGLIKAAEFGFRAEREIPMSLFVLDISRRALECLDHVVKVNGELREKLDIPEGVYPNLSDVLRREFESKNPRKAASVSA